MAGIIECGFVCTFVTSLYHLTLYKYAMPVGVTWRNVSPREDGFPEGGARGKTILPRGDIPSCYPHWHGIFVLLYRTNPVCNCKQSKVTDDWWFTHSPLGVASGNGQHDALTDGIRQHDDCSLLSQPITAYDLQVRYNNTVCIIWHDCLEGWHTGLSKSKMFFAQFETSVECSRTVNICPPEVSWNLEFPLLSLFRPICIG